MATYEAEGVMMEVVYEMTFEEQSARAVDTKALPFAVPSTARPV